MELKLIIRFKFQRLYWLNNLIFQGETPESSDTLPSPVTLSEASWSIKAKEKLKYDGIFDVRISYKFC